MVNKYNVTSVRLTVKTQTELEYAGEILHKSKSWIINHALEEYLSRLNLKTLKHEAKKQSLLANEADKHDEDSDLWENNMDKTGWSE